MARIHLPGIPLLLDQIFDIVGDFGRQQRLLHFRIVGECHDIAKLPGSEIDLLAQFCALMPVIAWQATQALLTNSTLGRTRPGAAGVLSA